MELADTEKEVKWLRTTFDCYEKEYEQNQKKILEFRMELDRERNESKKLEEEIEEANGEVMEMGSESEEAAIQKLQDEIKECKATLKCGVCFDRPNEVVWEGEVADTVSTDNDMSIADSGIRYPSHARMWLAPIRTGLGDQKMDDFESAMRDWYDFVEDTDTHYGVNMNVLTQPCRQENE